MGDSLKNLVILISGASSGIGRSCAVELARWGPKLALTGRNEENLRETVDRCKKQGLSSRRIFTVTGDVTVKEDVDRIVDSTAKHFGRLDVLINNAGATRVRNVDNCEIEDLDWCYNVLVRSVFMMSKAAIPHLEKSKGAIINMSSLAGTRPLHYAVPYSMCKNMVDRFTQILSVAVGPRGIRVNSVNPATVKTEMFDKPDGPGGTDAKKKAYLDWCEKAVPGGRIGEVEEIARLVAFLCSTEADYLNGANFPIDGSYSNTSFVPKLDS